MATLRVDVWSDVVCPWCYIGKRRLEAGLARFAHRGAVQVVWRAFELDASAPRKADGSTPYAARLAKKYGLSVADAETRLRQMTEVAGIDGLDFRFDRIRPGNTFDAHRVLHLAAHRGVQDAVKERFFRGYMSEGEAIGDPDAIARLAGEAGLDASDVRAMLSTNAYAGEVRADEEQARALGVRGVPFFVFGDRYAISGAQPADVLLRALEQAWRDAAGASPMIAEGAACGPEGCA